MLVANLISSLRISRASPARYVAYSIPISATVANGTIHRWCYPFSAPARLVDIVLEQVSAVVGGTSFTVDVKNAATTSLLTTLSVSTLASGNFKTVDAKGELALPSGWTRPVLKTDSTVDIVKGGHVDIATVETGTYSTHATISVTLIFEAKQ